MTNDKVENKADEANQNISIGVSDVRSGSIGEPTVSKELEDKIKKMEDDIEQSKVETKKKIESTQSSFLTAFGILASLITFISVEIQIFKSICNIERSLGITFVILGGLLLFCILIRSLLSEFNRKKDTIFRLVFVPSVLFLCFGAFQIGNTTQSEYRCVEKEYTEKFDKLKQETKKDIKLWKESILSGQIFTGVIVKDIKK